MPVIIRLWLVPEYDVCLSLRNAPEQGWFLALASRLDPVWADTLHAQDVPPTPITLRPYTVSPFYCPPRTPLSLDDTIGEYALPILSGDTESRFVAGGSAIALRISLVEDDRAAHLLSALRQIVKQGLPPLGSVRCCLLRIPTLAGADPDVLTASWKDLIAAPAAARLHLAFTTPAHFSSQGDQILFPDPARLWSGWWRVWRRWCPFPLPLADPLHDALTSTLPAALVAHLPRISAYNLHTRPVRLKQGLFIGFMGEVELDWRRDTPHEVSRALTTLAGLADFVGTGAKTTMGMGQTRLRILEREA